MRRKKCNPVKERVEIVKVIQTGDTITAKSRYQDHWKLKQLKY